MKQHARMVNIEKQHMISTGHVIRKRKQQAILQQNNNDFDLNMKQHTQFI